MNSETTEMQLTDFIKSVAEDAFKIVGAVAYDEGNNVLLFSPDAGVYPYIKLPASQVASVTTLRNSKLFTQGGWKKVTVASLQLVEPTSEEAKFLQELYIATMKHIGEHLAKSPGATNDKSCSCEGGGEVRMMDACGCLNFCLGGCFDGHCLGVCG